MATNAAADVVVTANGLAKKVFGSLRDLMPGRNNKLLGRIKFDSSSMVGKEYAENVWLTMEHGFTYAGSTGAKVTLNSSEVATSKEATLTPNAINFRTEIVDTLLSRTVSAGEKAFQSYWTRSMINTKKSFFKRLEVAYNRGGLSLATLAGATDAVTTSVMTITDATWAPHIWINQKNCPLDAYNGATKLNTNGDLVLTVVNVKDKKLTITAAAADIDAIVAIGTSGSGVELYFKGSKGADGTGIAGIASLSSGTYLSIDADTYKDVWNATQVPVSGEATWRKFYEGIEECVGRGNEHDLILQVSGPTWNSLNSSLDALKVLDSSYSVSKAEMGREADAITFHSLGIKVTVEYSGFQQEGSAVAYPNPSGEGDLRRIGSTDVTFDVPGRGGEMFRLVENANTVEYRAMTDQALWTTDVRSFIHFTDITNS